MLKLSTVCTGSSGNCYILEDENESIMIDAGGVFKSLLKKYGNELKKCKAALITHEHKDHSAMIKDLLKYGIDVYATKETAKFCGFDENVFYKQIQYMGKYNIGSFQIIPFDTLHDAVEPCGFLIKHKITGINILYATDTYKIKYDFKDIHYWMVECNFSVNSLNDGLNEKLIQRILHSHMSAENLSTYFKKAELKDTREIFLCHMSETNGDQLKMLKQIKDASNKPTTQLTKGSKNNLSLTPF